MLTTCQRRRLDLADRATVDLPLRNHTVARRSPLRALCLGPDAAAAARELEQRSRDHPPLRGRLTLTECQILLLNPTRLEGLAERLVGRRAPRQHHHARGLPVEPMHHPEPFAAQRLQLVRQTFRGLFPTRRDDGEARRLVDDEQVVPLEKNRNVQGRPVHCRGQKRRRASSEAPCPAYLPEPLPSPLPLEMSNTLSSKGGSRLPALAASAAMEDIEPQFAVVMKGKSM